MHTHIHTPNAYLQMLLCVFLTAAVRSFMWPWVASHTWKGECVTIKADIWDLIGDTVYVCVDAERGSELCPIPSCAWPQGPDVQTGRGVRWSGYPSLGHNNWRTVCLSISYAHKLYVTAAVCPHSPSAPHRCSVDSILLPAECVHASCLHLLAHTHTHTHRNPQAQAQIMSN